MGFGPNNTGRGGRGSGRGFYRYSGRGRGYQNKSNSTNNKSTGNKDYRFHLHGAGKEKQNATYGKVLEKILLKIQQTFEKGSAIVDSINANKYKIPEEPEREESTETDVNKKAFDQKSKDKVFDKKVELWLAERDIFEENKRKAYALIYDHYCGKEMQIAIKELEDYDSVVKYNPLALLKRIESLMQTLLRARYPYLSSIEVLSS